MSRVRRPASAAPIVFVATTVAVMVVHTAARDHLWRYEWRWATYQYHFGVILIGPVVCGVAAWSGRGAAAGRWLTHTAARPVASVHGLVVAVAATWAAYVVSWLVPAAIVLRSETTDHLTAGAMLTFVPALAALAAYCAVGFALGVSMPSRLTAPLAAVGAFALTMAGWIAGAEHVVRLGGAGTSMVSLVPRAVVGGGQVACYGAVAVLSAGWAARHLGGGRHARVVLAPFAVLLVLSGGWLLTTTTPVFDHPDAEPVCVAAGSGRTQFCAARPYLAPLRRLAGRLAPMVARIDAVGGDVPPRFALGNAVEIFEADPSPAVVAAELAPLLGIGECAVMRPPDELMYLSVWLALVVGDTAQTERRALDPSLPEPLRGDDPVAQDAWASSALSRATAACRPGG